MTLCRNCGRRERPWRKMTSIVRPTCRRCREWLDCVNDVKVCS